MLVLLKSLKAQFLSELVYPIQRGQIIATFKLALQVILHSDVPDIELMLYIYMHARFVEVFEGPVSF